MLENKKTCRARWLCLVLVTGLVAGRAAAQDIPQIPYNRYVLDNGLTLVVHEDHKAPIVSVHVWYHVGSKNETAGRTGFAHLYEHLMFNGSEHHDDEYFGPLEKAGASNINGTTSFDRTNYYETIPNSALDLALWLESDRMGYMLEAITQEKLDEQRGVVQNEKRQGENQPYGRVFNNLIKAVFPAGHPYSWLPIGSMDDLNAASLEDVKDWFKTYYGPNNAVLVVAGDVDPDEVHERVKHFFGEIPPGPPLTKPTVWVPKHTEERRETQQDRVPQGRIYKVWVVPQQGTTESSELVLVANALASGKNSRLYKRLVYDQQLATSVSASPLFNEIAGLFLISATVTPGGDQKEKLAEVERVIDEELQQFIAEGPSKKELLRARTQYRAGFITGMETVESKAEVLADGQVYQNDPAFFAVELARLDDATAGQIRDAAATWLSAGAYVLEVLPFPELSAGSESVDRTELPMPSSFPAGRFPGFGRHTLSNGMTLLTVQRNDVPVVGLRMLFDAGYAADKGGLPGTATLAMGMLDEGTGKLSALEISEQLDLLGATLGAGSNLDMSNVSMSVLSENLDSALDLYADVILNPSFPPADFERLRLLQLAGIEREYVSPVQMALRVLPDLMYGPGHSYSVPFTGTGTPEALEAMTVGDLRQFQQTWLKPDNATLVAVGDFETADLVSELEKRFGDWQPGVVPEKNIATVAPRNASTIFLMDRPGSEQSVIIGAQLIRPPGSEEELAIQAMNDVLGGSFTARLNMNLREEKHWSYGASSLVVNALGQRPFLLYAPVQVDRTSDSMAVMMEEVTGMLGDNPPREDELQRVKNQNVRSLPGRWETGAAVSASLAEIVRYDLPDDYWQQYSGRLNALDLAEVTEAADTVLKPEQMVWVVVGDRARIEDPIRELGWGEIRFLGPQGRLISDP